MLFLAAKRSLLSVLAWAGLSACGGSVAAAHQADRPDAGVAGLVQVEPDGGFDAGPKADAGAMAMSDAGALDAGSLAERLLALTTRCTPASQARYAPDDGASATIDICGLNGAYFWTADLDVDCDGQASTQCNSTVDPDFQNQTSFTQSNGKALDAAQLPFVVVPLPSSRFDFRSSNIKPGALCIVLYNGHLEFGVFGDEGPSNIIGEASYAMAKSLGINPNPRTGGVDRGVTYFVLAGSSAVVKPIEDHQAAVVLGNTLAQQLIDRN